MMKLIFIAVALLSGVAVFLAILMLVKGGIFAVRRKKTKLGLVKVAGAGLKLGDEDEPEDSDGQPVAANGGGAGISAGNDAGAGAAGVDADIAAAGVAAAEVSDGFGASSSGEDAEREETIAVPLEGIKEDSGAADRPPPAPPKPSVGGGDKRDSGESRPFGEKLHLIDDVPVGPSSVGTVRKIVELPVENPFLSGRTPSSGGGHDKKTAATPQRRRLPETVKMKDRKVILAEDVAINRDLIAMYFDGSGVKFEFAVNGREVCEKFERDPGAYSLILMDIQMPEMDGYEVSRRIRSMDVDWAKQIPIIAMTGNDQKEDIDLCFEAGMDDHIPKPIDMEVLQDKVFDIITLNSESF